MKVSLVLVIALVRIMASLQEAHHLVILSVVVITSQLNLLVLVHLRCHVIFVELLVTIHEIALIVGQLLF